MDICREHIVGIFIYKILLPYSFQIAELIFGEFFDQGDLERQKFNKVPEVSQIVFSL